jgi:hypothetical protein
MLQLQLPTHSGGAGTVTRTAPQWQLPVTAILLPPIRLPHPAGAT